MKFYGQFKNPSVDEYLYNEFFKDKTNGFFIESGAANGIADASCKFFEEFKGWKGLNVEAHPGTFKYLEKNRPLSTNVNKALTSPEEEGKMLKFNSYDFPDRNAATINHFGPHAPIGFLDSAKKHRGDVPIINLNSKGTLDVEGITYKALVETYGVSHVDLFVLDVEGSELEVIKGMKGCLILPDVFCIEANKIDKDLLDQMLDELGYKYYSMVHVNAHYVRK